MEPLIIAHLYPDLMNLYGDGGNLTCLKKRINDYGWDCEILPVLMNHQIDFTRVDMIFMGGGTDRGQLLVYNNLIEFAGQLMQEIDKGLPALFICGAYQILGKYSRPFGGQPIKGLGLFDFHTECERNRLIGNILLESQVGGGKQTVIGFENHAGRLSFKDRGLKAFGAVIKGYGNNGRDGSEGLWYKNLIGTFLHGPLLPKNPHIADYLIKAALDRKGIEKKNNLDDHLERYAHQEAIKRLGPKKTLKMPL